MFALSSLELSSGLVRDGAETNSIFDKVSISSSSIIISLQAVILTGFSETIGSSTVISAVADSGFNVAPVTLCKM